MVTLVMLALIVAGVFASIDIYKSNGKALTSWGVLLIAVVLLIERGFLAR